MVIVTAISLAAVSFVVQAHETGMTSAKEYGGLIQLMEHASPSKTVCSEGTICKTDSGLCAYSCAGISMWPPLERHPVKQDSRQRKYLVFPDAVLLATVPSLNDRPPISRLL